MTASRLPHVATLAACAALLAPAAAPARQGQLCERVFRDAGTGEPTTISLLVTRPLAGERFRAFSPDCPATVEGLASTVGIPARFDFYLALDLSGSTHYSSGVDVNGDGAVSEVTVSPDSIFEAELLAARRFLEALDFRHHRVSLVTFDLAAEVIHPLSDDRQSLRASLDAISPPELTARTNFARPLELILGEHAAAHDPDREQVVLFLSDGAPNVIGGAPEDPVPCVRSPSDCVGIQWSAEAAARGLRVNTFAIGIRASTSALRAMADVGGGRLEQLDVAGEIIHALPRSSHVGIAEVRVENLSTGASLVVQPGPDGAFLAPMEFAAGENEIRVSVVADHESDWTVSCESTVEAHCLEISCPGALQRECDGGGARVEDFAAWASDPTVRVSASRSDGGTVQEADAGGVYALGRTQVRWTFEDDEAGMATCSSVVDVVDTLPPRMTRLQPIVHQGCGESLDAPVVQTEDECDEQPQVLFEERRVEGGCPDSFELLRSWTVTDASGLEATAAQLVVVSDDSPPRLSATPADARVACDAVPPVPAVSAQDGCDPSPRLDFAEARIDGHCPGSYTLERSWLSVDRCGNFIDHLQRIEVVDDEPPVIVPRKDATLVVASRNHSLVRVDAGEFAPTVTDGCSDQATWQVAACVSDQPDDALGDGSTTGDCSVDADGRSLWIRAERQGRGASKHQGRSYAVLAVAEDPCGNVSAPTRVATVRVPHDSSR